MIDKNQDIEVFNIFRLMTESNIPYVSWKNNHEIEDFMDKGSDLDLYIPIKYKSEFINIAKKSWWVLVFNPVAKFDSIEHFYTIDKGFNIYHLHVYFEIVTGESWTKEYRLPIGDFLMNNRCNHKEFGIDILNDKCQAYLFALRHILKCGSITSRLLYLKEIDSYQSEWKLCNFNASNLKGYGPILLNEVIDNSGLLEGFSLSKYINSMVFRFKLRPYLRINYFLLSVYRAKSFIVRLVNKLFLKRKKLLKNKGQIISISGVDGSGKSSMVDMLDLNFSRFLTVRRLSLGKPQGKVIEFFRKLLHHKRINKNIVKKKKNEQSTTLFKSISLVILAILRIMKSNKAKHYSNKGYVVLVDRWPTLELGKMDGPKINSSNKSNFLVKFLSKFEKKIYKAMPSADICFFLEVSVDTAIKRNFMRIKDDKETESEIRERHIQNKNIKPITKKLIMFDNNGVFEEKKKELMLLVRNELLDA